ncbi:MAG: flavodoxin family protein [Firmicutes bacterium]|nr:flavodoxin family protein [Bacillota bacterium]
MKVILINGSPNKNGCTKRALNEVASELTNAQIEVEHFHIGANVSPCTACYKCVENKNGRCVITKDSVNDFLQLAETADGYVFGSPVYFASASGGINSFMDRVFFVGRHKIFPLKPASIIVSCRRAGSSAALDNLTKYLTISQMPVVSSHYWNMVHGSNPSQVEQDLEGMQIMRTLGRNMAWLLKSIEAGKEKNIALPEKEKRVQTNFIR